MRADREGDPCGRTRTQESSTLAACAASGGIGKRFRRPCQNVHRSLRVHRRPRAPRPDPGEPSPGQVSRARQPRTGLCRGDDLRGLRSRAAVSHRPLWTRAGATRRMFQRTLSARLRRAGAGLRLLVVAEDWCVDSANTVPLGGVSGGSLWRRRCELSIEGAGGLRSNVSRPVTAALATPLIVLIRVGAEPRAWVERPKPLQTLFAALLTDPCRSAGPQQPAALVRRGRRSDGARGNCHVSGGGECPVGG